MTDQEFFELYEMALVVGTTLKYIRIGLDEKATADQVLREIREAYNPLGQRLEEIMYRDYPQVAREWNKPDKEYIARAKEIMSQWQQGNYEEARS